MNAKLDLAIAIIYWFLTAVNTIGYVIASQCISILAFIACIITASIFTVLWYIKNH